MVAAADAAALVAGDMLELAAYQPSALSASHPRTERPDRQHDAAHRTSRWRRAAPRWDATRARRAEHDVAL
jgi:hypothetical protein